MALKPIVLYGASGYTGRLVAAELDRLGAPFLLAGRSAAALSSLSKTLPSRPAVSTVPVDDAPALRALLGTSAAVLSCAGPFRTLGPPLLEAALAAGVPFADITGDQEYLAWVHAQDARARNAGVAVVNAVGFDVVPSDLACVLASRKLPDVESLDVVIASRAKPSAGTRRSMADAAGRTYWFGDGRLRPAPPGRFGRAIEIPGMGKRSVVFVPWGDVVTAPRSTGARTVRTFFLLPPGPTRTLRWTWPLTSLLAPLSRGSLARRASGAAGGPTEAERARAAFAIVAEARSRGGEVARGVVSGRDPYGLTAATAARAAMRLSAGKVPPGVRTPSQAFDLEALLHECEGFDLAWS